MIILKPSDVADLRVRKTYRNRPTDGYSWWLAVTHDLPEECSVGVDVLLDVSRRHSGADVDLIINRDQGADGPEVYAEIVVWIEPRKDLA